MKTTTIHNAKTHLSRILREVQAGESVVILNGRTPVAKLMPVESQLETRPSAGTRTSEPVRYVDAAFEPLEGTELEEWGL